MAPRPDVTQLLLAVESGEEGASERLLERVYEELRAMARAQMARERPGHTLQPTALVHEAYLRLVGGAPRWENRAHFFASAAQAMRRVLVEAARARMARKRGGGTLRVSLGEVRGGAELAPEELLDLDRALARLESRDPLMARVVALRYFTGLNVEETAAALGTSPRTVQRLWTAARAWLQVEAGTGPRPAPPRAPP
jgi:RNA polymerase sigma factor (TIGR02999 family)